MLAGLKAYSCSLKSLPQCNWTDDCRGSDDVLYYSVRSTPSGGPHAPPLTGPKIENDLPTQEWDERLLGQIDSVEAGTVSGWACLRGQLEKPLQVQHFTNWLCFQHSWGVFAICLLVSNQISVCDINLK